jgi:hypothetical protein
MSEIRADVLGWERNRLPLDPPDGPQGAYLMNWIQFVHVLRKDEKGNPLSDDVPDFHPNHRLDKFLYSQQGPNAEAVVDSDGPSPYYGGGTIRDEHSLAIFDKPNSVVFPKENVAAEIIQSFDDYLISGDEVYYHVHWEERADVLGRGTDEARTHGHLDADWISGEPVDRLPPWARGDRLLLGYKDYTKRFDPITGERYFIFQDPITVDNPISAKHRGEWSGQSAVTGGLLP